MFRLTLGRFFVSQVKEISWCREVALSLAGVCFLLLLLKPGIASTTELKTLCSTPLFKRNLKTLLFRDADNV